MVLRSSVNQKGGDALNTPFVPLISTLGVPTNVNTKLLLHLDGADGATTSTDSSPLAQTVTFNGNAQLDTAQSMFGASSLLLNSDIANDFLGAFPAPNFEPGAGEFSIFAFVRPDSTSGIRAIIDKGWGDANTKGFVLYKNNDSLAFEWSSSGTGATGSLTVSGVMYANIWQMVGVTRNADDVINLFAAPVSEDIVPVVATESGATAAQTIKTGGSNHIGLISSGAFDYGGHIDELLLTTECLADAEFAMPTGPFSLV